MRPPGLGETNSQRLSALRQNPASAASILDTEQISRSFSTSSPTSTTAVDASLVALAYLAASHNGGRPAVTDTQAQTLNTSVCEAVNALQSSTDTESQAQAAEAHIAVLDALSQKLDEQFLISISRYTNASDSWTTTNAALSADRVLAYNLPSHQQCQDFIAGPVLQDFLRPIFAKSNKSITSNSARPSKPQPPNPVERWAADAAEWKQSGLSIVSTFRWAVTSADDTLIAKNWPLFIPVIITLCEDTDVHVRQHGLDILTLFIAKCPLRILRSTGVDAVLQDAVFPSLLFLPTLTPENESVPLLRAAYKALITMALIDEDKGSKQRRELLDKLIRDGILAGYSHSPEHIRVVEVLMQATSKVAQAQGVYTVKHLQNLLQVFQSIITDSFALAYVPAVEAAIQALNNTLVACWPRVATEPKHLDQVVYMISVAWINVQERRTSKESNADSLQPVIDELEKCSRLLQSLWEVNDGKPKDLSQALEKEPRLKALFG